MAATNPAWDQCGVTALVVGEDIVPRPPNEKIVWLREEYELLSGRVLAKLGL